MTGWIELDRAPRDGSDILAVWPNNVFGVVWYEDGDWHEYDISVVIDGFTHWMPLPPSPTSPPDTPEP